MDAHKEVLSIQVDQNENSKYWLGVLNELKNRDVKDILILCADGLSSIKGSINVAFKMLSINAALFIKYVTP